MRTVAVLPFCTLEGVCIPDKKIRGKTLPTLKTIFVVLIGSSLCFGTLACS